MLKVKNESFNKKCLNYEFKFWEKATPVLLSFIFITYFKFCLSFSKQTNNWQSNVENVNIPLNILTSNIELCRLVYANMKC